MKAQSTGTARRYKASSRTKYCGDVLMQKTFCQDFISHKIVKNVGQLPMYYIKDHHEGIVSREIYDAVQAEIARRNALKSPSKSMRPPAKVHMPANMRCRNVWSAASAAHCTGAAHGSAPAESASYGAVSAVWITGKSTAITRRRWTKARCSRQFWPLSVPR